MIGRIWRIEYKKEEKDKLIQFANKVSKPFLTSRPGNRGVFFLSQGKYWLTITFWDNKRSIAEMENDANYQNIVDEIHMLGVLVGESSTEIWEVH